MKAIRSTCTQVELFAPGGDVSFALSVSTSTLRPTREQIQAAAERLPVRPAVSTRTRSELPRRNLERQGLFATPRDAQAHRRYWPPTSAPVECARGNGTRSAIALVCCTERAGTLRDRHARRSALRAAAYQ